MAFAIAVVKMTEETSILTTVSLETFETLASNLAKLITWEKTVSAVR